MKIIKRAALVIAGLFVGLVVLGMLVGEEELSPARQADREATVAASPTPDESEADEDETAAAPARSADCMKVHPSMVDALQFGIKKKTKAQVVGKGFAVRSNDYDKVWMVAYELDGPGLEGPGDVAVWGTNGDPGEPAGSGLILQANGLAEQFSVWGAAAGAGSDADLSPADHGVAEAVECVTSS